MIFKRLFIILVSSIVLLNSAYSEERVKGYTGTGNSKQAVQQAKEMCKNIGYNPQTSKFDDCVVKLVSANLKNLKKQDVSNSEDSKYVFTGEKTFGKSKKNQKNNKRVAEYMTYPDKNLCIGYINNYGVMFKKAKQKARAEAIRIRGLDCSQFRDAAFYDIQRRRTEIADATKRALNENAESKRRIAESYNKNKSQSERCTYRKVGSYVRKTCY